ncbi:MAG: hypothetical protein KDK23_13620 [Leptospiraceae bacterium]|nr:hypothetical protein [Leptospiraceae bacterium]
MKILAWIILGLLLAAGFVGEFFFLEHHGEHWWNHVPAFYAILGLSATFLLIAVARILGKLLKRDVDYYD